jgi:uncharacterized membrane protein
MQDDQFFRLCRNIQERFTLWQLATHSIEVNTSLPSAYDQWTRFEEFQRFMEGVEEVRQESDRRLFWKAKIGDRVKEWEAEVTHRFLIKGSPGTVWTEV